MKADALFRGTDLPQASEDCHMPEIAPPVLPGSYLRGATLQGEGEHDVGTLGYGIYTNLHAGRYTRQMDRRLVFGGGAGNLCQRTLRFGAVELGDAIDHHLGGVRTFDAEVAGIGLLAKSIGVRGEGVAPALVVPVVYVLAEDDR